MPIPDNSLLRVNCAVSLRASNSMDHGRVRIRPCMRLSVTRFVGLATGCQMCEKARIRAGSRTGLPANGICTLFLSVYLVGVCDVPRGLASALQGDIESRS